MSQPMNVACWACVLGVVRLATAAYVGGNLRRNATATISISTEKVGSGGKIPDLQITDAFTPTMYGKAACPCVGIDNMEGYYATNLDYYHVQYPLEAGAACFPWDMDVHPDCNGGGAPEWCMQRWCYIDPCNCDLEDLPAMSKAGVEYQGAAAYWSYDTCGFMDLYSKAKSPDACIMQNNSAACKAHTKCAWDGSRCGGKKAVETCKQALQLDEGLFGQDDCRCVGLAGRDPGHAFLYINKDDQIAYPPDVGSTCKAWEADTHPECLKEDGEVPEWCGQSWCFVDPCKCKTSIPPKIVMEANQFLKFQGKTAFWSPETCGNADTWTKAHASMYCITQKSEEDCANNKRCAWTGTQCLGTALVSICAKQRKTGLLGFEVFPHSGSIGLRSFSAFLSLLGVLAAV